MRLRATLAAAGTLLAAGVTTTATAASAAPPAAPVLQPSLTRYLGLAAPTAPVRVLVQADGSLRTATSAVRAAGLRLETSLDRVGIAVAVGTPVAVRRLAGTRGVTRLDWADEPLSVLSGTSHTATRAVPVQDGRLDVDGDGTGDAFDGRGLAVAVVDTGVDGTHPMLQGPNGSRVRKNVKVVCDDVLPLLAGFSSTLDSCFVDATAVNDTDSPSAGGHGTHVAGVAAGARVTDASGRRLRGAAPAAEVVGVSIGAGINTYGGALGLYWVLEHHADPCGDGSCAPIVAVNNSWGPSSKEFSATEPAVVVARALVDAGVTVVWAAGNSGGDGSSPQVASYGLDPTPGVLAVANYDDGGTGSRDNALEPGSSRGRAGDPSSYPDLSAPGTEITSACRPYLPVCSAGQDTADPSYNTLTGTSQAAPHVAGYVALLQDAATRLLHRLLTPAEVEGLLVDTAHPFGTTSWEADTRNPASTTPTSFDEGHGLVDVTAALTRLVGHVLTSVGSSSCTADARFADPVGDATGVEGVATPLPSEAGLDLTGAWFTSSAATHDVTARWTVTDLPDSPGGTSGTGEAFELSVRLAGGTYVARAQRDLFLGESFTLQDESGAAVADLQGSFDAANDRITVTLPAGRLGLTTGSVLSQPVLTSFRYAAWSSAADTAPGECAFTVL